MLKGERLLLFIEGVAEQVSATIGISEAIGRLADSVDEEHQPILKRISIRIDEGETFSKLAEEYELLPSKMIPPIRSGEIAGKLPDVLYGILEHEMVFETVLEKSKKALIPPLAILFTVLVVFVGFLLYVFPAHAKNLPAEKQNEGLFWLSTQMVHISQTTPWVFAIPIVAIAWLVYAINTDPKIKQALFNFGLTMPIYGNGVKHMLWSGWCNYVSIGTKAGVTFVESVKNTSPMLGEELAEPFYAMADEALNGNGWDAALDSNLWSVDDGRNEWPLSLTTAFLVGGSTGRLDTSLSSAAISLRKRGEKKISQAVDLSNKIAMAIAALGVLALIMSLLLAQYSAMQAV